MFKFVSAVEEKEKVDDKIILENFALSNPNYLDEKEKQILT
jgi:hypothetical protein